MATLGGQARREGTGLHESTCLHDVMQGSADWISGKREEFLPVGVPGHARGWVTLNTSQNAWFQILFATRQFFIIPRFARHPASANTVVCTCTKARCEAFRGVTKRVVSAKRVEKTK